MNSFRVLSSHRCSISNDNVRYLSHTCHALNIEAGRRNSRKIYSEFLERRDGAQMEDEFSFTDCSNESFPKDVIGLFIG